MDQKLKYKNKNQKDFFPKKEENKLFLSYPQLYLANGKVDIHKIA